MTVDDTLLEKLENLSYLRISDDKRDEIKAQLTEMISFVENLSELDTTGVDDTFAMTDAPTQLREDIPQCDTAINDAILEHAPKSDDHFFIVPKIIE